MAQFKPGISGNYKGRPRGRSRSTESIRGVIRRFVSANINNIQDDFNRLQPKERLILFERLLRHVLPSPVDELEKLSDADLDRIIEKIKNDRLKVA